MLLLLYFSLLFFVIFAHDIFRGVQDLDQELDEDIIPGGDVQLGEFPFTAAVFNGLRKFYTCMGIIISDRVVLTAGYCVSIGPKIVEKHYVSVLGGVTDMRDHHGDQWRHAESITGSLDKYNDMSTFALIKVSAGFYINYSLRTISFNRRDYFSSYNCTALTWLFHDSFNRITLKSLVQKQYQVSVLNRSSCREMYSNNPGLLDLGSIKYVCLIFDKSNARQQECAGIDGSAVFCEEHSLLPIGIAASLVGGSMCNRIHVPYVFYDIGAVGEWIHEERSKLTQD